MPKEMLEQEKSQWSEFLSDFENIYPVFAKHGLGRNAAFAAFVHFDGAAPCFNPVEEDGEEWRRH